MSTTTLNPAALLARAKAVAFPFVHFGGSQHLAGEARWSKVSELLPAELAAVDEQLAGYEAEARRRAESDTRMAADDERRAEVNAPPDEALRDDTVAELRADLDRHEAERPERVEALLGRAVELLEVLARSKR